MLVSVKAVDPKVYPFYGEIRYRAARSALARRSPPIPSLYPTIVLLRLNLKVGDTLQLGDQPFRIVGQVIFEPDRMLGTLNVGPRVMITRAGLDRTRPDAARQPRRPNDFCFALGPASPGIEQVRAGTEERLSRRADRRFPRVAPHHHAGPQPRHHVLEPGEFDHADRRRSRRGHRDASAHPAAHGLASPS